MEQAIKERIQAFNNTEAVSLFFNLLNKLITELSISPDNERLALNVRNDSQKRISVNLNSRLVLAIQETGNDPVLAFMISEEDFEGVSKQYKIINSWPFKEEDSPALLIEIPYLELISKENSALINSWIIFCRQYAPKQLKSQYRKHHNPELYKMATDPTLLQPYLSDTENAVVINNGTFKDIVNSFREFLKSDSSILKDFSIQKVGSNWAWIEDSQQLIGNKLAHYEIYKEKKKPVCRCTF